MTSDRSEVEERRYSACHCCDALYEQVLLKEGMSARCVRCGAMLYQNRPASLQRASAFSLAALVAMVVVHFFPFLTMDAASMRRELTLAGTAEALISSGMVMLGGFVVLFTMVTPLVLAGGFLYVCLPLWHGVSVPGAKWVAKWIYRSEPWNMAEVFLLGVLVSLLKLDKVADVEFGVGFWAFACVMVCLGGAVAGIDKEELWDLLEEAES
jgi:paraquat-inducible protein A